MYRAREALVDCRTKLINTVRGWMRGELLSVRSGGVRTFADRARERALDRPEGLPAYIERLLVSIEQLNDQIAAADAEMKTLAHESELCCRLMTVPGVGAVTAVRFVAAVDDITRFPNAGSVESFLGLTPGEHSSSTRKARLGITKAGPADVRKLLSQSAWCFWRVRPEDPAPAWASRVAARRGRPIASVGLARKMAGILYAIWRDGTVYEPGHAAQVLEEAQSAA
jgi:transposase